MHKLNDFYDGYILNHGFAKNSRQYEFIVETYYLQPGGLYKISFDHVYELKYISIIDDNTLQISRSEIYLNHDKWIESGSPPGYVWGVNNSVIDPGFAEIKNSKKAINWTKKLELEMKAIEIVTNIFKITFVCHDYHIDRIESNSTIPNSSIRNS